MARLVSLLVCVLVLVVSVVWAEITVYPLSLKLPVLTGGEATTGFWVENVGEGPARVRITLHDWWRNREGKLQVFPPGSLSGSCAPWVLFSHPSLLLAPEEKVWVSVKVSIPEEERGDRWAMFLVAEYPPEEEGGGEAFGRTRVVVAYAVKLLRQDPWDASPAGEIRSVEVLGVNPLQLYVLYANTGNAHTVNRGTVEVRDIFGDTVLSFPIEDFPTLPGEERALILEDPTGGVLAEGVYYVFTTIDFGGEYLVQGGITFQVPMPSE